MPKRTVHYIIDSRVFDPTKDEQLFDGFKVLIEAKTSFTLAVHPTWAAQASEWFRSAVIQSFIHASCKVDNSVFAGSRSPIQQQKAIEALFDQQCEFNIFITGWSGHGDIKTNIYLNSAWNATRSTASIHQQAFMCRTGGIGRTLERAQTFMTHQLARKKKLLKQQLSGLFANRASAFNAVGVSPQQLKAPRHALNQPHDADTAPKKSVNKERRQACTQFDFDPKALEDAQRAAFLGHRKQASRNLAAAFEEAQKSAADSASESDDNKSYTL
jgi:hypothetical protein